MSRSGDGIVLGQLVVLDPACLDGGKHHGCFGKKSRAIPLHELGGRCAEGDDEVGGLVRIERLKIIDKWCERLVVVHPSSQKRVVLESLSGLSIAWSFQTEDILRNRSMA